MGSAALPGGCSAAPLQRCYRRWDSSVLPSMPGRPACTQRSEQRLRRQIGRLKELRAADVEEISQLKADVEALVGTLHQATVENQLLHQQLAERTAVLRPLPSQPPCYAL
ncbi:hypothetical protein FNV62_06770 [Streptomyces sp. RLB3-17]|uniref:hypothetical protein n=1 Tax=Streptomyces sp. RLB3-17 TaxID=2594455 RepID=UPI0011652040|nr:hypothetical protein [Streptomyces sp. RLB3-17]QDO37909.1 hypothetical protein FNV62_06770 [Streptomyces sp. RLB3-17]